MHFWRGVLHFEWMVLFRPQQYYSEPKIKCGNFDVYFFIFFQTDFPLKILNKDIDNEKKSYLFLQLCWARNWLLFFYIYYKVCHWFWWSKEIRKWIQNGSCFLKIEMSYIRSGLFCACSCFFFPICYRFRLGWWFLDDIYCMGFI